MLRIPPALAICCLLGIALSSLDAENLPEGKPVYITTLGNRMWLGSDIITVENFGQWLTENATRLGRKTPIVFSEGSRRFLGSRFDLIQQAQGFFDRVYLVVWDEKNMDQQPLVLSATHDDITPIIAEMRQRAKSSPGGTPPKGAPS